ncbi:MAG TPA: RIP metalloprotease RseP [Novosphingobium sp.]|nr:RIP metalloprotease RseP [Novosphingobium sp.]HZV10480.1 RIP metalloprotease RseP [Novosphingobium sp.]
MGAGALAHLAQPSLLLILVAFALLLGPLVMLHELGHYAMGRLFGVKADAFSIGFGRELIGWTDRRGTRWKVSMLPLGGYVQFAGDANAASLPTLPPADRAAAAAAGFFHAKPLWQRALVVLAGPLANLLIAVTIFATFNLVYGRIEALPVVAGLAPGSAAEVAGLKLDDRIVAIDEAPITSFEDIRAHVMPYPGAHLRLTVARGGQQLVLPVTVGTHVETDAYGNEARIGMLGVASGRISRVAVGPVGAVGLAFRQCADVMGMMTTGIGQIIGGQRSVKELGGPVKIAQYSGQQLAQGWLNFVDFAALISINLAFINLLPIPMLDGGHLAFYLAEAVRRRPVDLRMQEWAYRMGLALVLGLMLFVTLNDLASLHLFGR